MSRQTLRLDWLAVNDSVSAFQRIATVATIVLVISSLIAMLILEEENSLLRDEIERTQQDIDQRTRGPRITGETGVQRSKTNQLVAQHNELVAVLELLEKSTPDGILIESISLNPEAKSYRIELRTSDLEIVRRYVERLNGKNESRRIWQIVAIEALKQSAEWLAVLEIR